ncbi:MAG: heme lyase CcmF/NrfE family subunit [Actinomycetia bacterium]|nr:heme lyase CcmF/NrfE family subunit [Actinomycetes bacterium]MCP3911668.1 heme lyase CcmF/NrfE family subunit [Actinomycetes bacterium]MCP4086937.1 heme lyase CcmF/NrfE family subunit [Actinomycetes bacterium]
MRAVRSHAVVALVGAFIAAVAMERALITRDFTVDFVADHGSSRTPALYNFATLWGALEGSIILWSLILVAYLVAVIFRFRDRLTDPLMAWALVTMFLVAAFFFALMIGPANPFGVVSPPPGYDGPGPHPLLQNHPLMAFHPPMLYLGYVGFTVPFAFAIGALVTGRLGEGWLVATRRWTLIAWGFLTVGIVLGAWWSYEVLGWGGYWAWDPVENASFLPWLTGTAYIHSVMVQERRGMLRVWNLSLLCATFSLTILGTFLTRSGVIASVHAFSESGIGPALLGLFAATIAVPVGLIAWRGDRLRAPGRIDSPISREGAFLANNVLFAAFAFVVLLGTVFPLLVEAVKGDEISVGTPYFDRMTMPIGMSLLFLMAVAPMLPWRKASGEILADRLRWPAWIGVAAVVLSVVIGARGVAPLIAFGLGGFAAGSALRQLVLASRRQGWRGFVGRANGGMIVHLGVVLVAVGLAASSSFLTDRVVRLEPGESTEVAGHTLTAIGSTETQHEEKVEVAAQIQVGSSGVYEPTLSRFIVSGQIIGTPSVRPGFREDIYLSLIEEPSGPQGSVLVRVIVQPLVTWIWTGGLIMGLGTVLSAFPGRRRRGTDPVSAPVPDAEPLIPQS